MSPPLLVLDGAPPSELKSGIVNSTRVRFRWQVLPSETKLRARSGVSPIVRNFAGAFFRPRSSTKLANAASNLLAQHQCENIAGSMERRCFCGREFSGATPPLQSKFLRK